MSLVLKRPPRFPPRAPRTAVNIETEILLPDDRILPFSVVNLSELGFAGYCTSPVSPGTCMGISLPGYGIARAVVRWAEDGELGCRFRNPLPSSGLCLVNVRFPAGIARLAIHGHRNDWRSPSRGGD